MSDFLSALAKIDTELQITGADDSSLTPTLVGPDSNDLKKIITGEGGDINTERNQNPSSPVIPDYYDEKDKALLSQKFPEREVDSKDYKTLAIQQLGSGFSYINDRESYENQLFEKNTFDDIVAADPNVRTLNNALQDRYPVREIFRQMIAQGMTDKDDPNFDERLEERVNQYFDGDALNEKGKARYNDFKGQYRARLDAIYSEAKREAASKASEYIEYKSALTTALKGLKIAGIEMGDEFSGYVEDIIRSGRHQQDENIDVAEQVAREIKLAIISDEKAWKELIRKIDQRGIEFGQAQGVKNYFKQN